MIHMGSIARETSQYDCNADIINYIYQDFLKAVDRK